MQQQIPLCVKRVELRELLTFCRGQLIQTRLNSLAHFLDGQEFPSYSALALARRAHLINVNSGVFCKPTDFAVGREVQWQSAF